ncbi:delta-like protein 1 [Lingula anatina]|uniref:Delta-like protein 1 n=1 Tax=Lingula anatina TaxID=7574 RepID=A0A1S3JR84_LINAN|nr:delta-like protein 1 [Lingula anatina]|eukprot:XP_013412895.1 delta-like protein 1 [Lingula anatina]
MLKALFLCSLMVLGFFPKNAQTTCTVPNNDPNASCRLVYRCRYYYGYYYYYYTCSCTCNPGFTGTAGYCTAINPCASGPCQNGGNCTVLTTGYSCQCPPAYAGTNCQLTQCDIQPDATCLRQYKSCYYWGRIYYYTVCECTCNDGFIQIGDTCV